MVRCCFCYVVTRNVLLNIRWASGVSACTTLSNTNMSKGYNTDASSTEDEEGRASVMSSRRTHGIHEWAEWRRHLNDTIIDIIEERHKVLSQPTVPFFFHRHSGRVDRITRTDVDLARTLSNFVINISTEDTQMNRKVPCLKQEAFLNFGLPRVKLPPSRDHNINQSNRQSNRSFVSEPSTSRSGSRNESR